MADPLGMQVSQAREEAPSGGNLWDWLTSLGSWDSAKPSAAPAGGPGQPQPGTPE